MILTSLRFCKLIRTQVLRIQSFVSRARSILLTWAPSNPPGFSPPEMQAEERQSPLLFQTSDLTHLPQSQLQMALIRGTNVIETPNKQTLSILTLSYVCVFPWLGICVDITLGLFPVPCEELSLVFPSLRLWFGLTDQIAIFCLLFNHFPGDWGKQHIWMASFELTVPGSVHSLMVSGERQQAVCLF